MQYLNFHEMGCKHLGLVCISYVPCTGIHCISSIVLQHLFVIKLPMACGPLLMYVSGKAAVVDFPRPCMFPKNIMFYVAIPLFCTQQAFACKCYLSEYRVFLNFITAIVYPVSYPVLYLIHLFLSETFLLPHITPCMYFLW